MGGLERRSSVLLSYSSTYWAGTRTRVVLVLWESLVVKQRRHISDSRRCKVPGRKAWLSPFSHVASP